MLTQAEFNATLQVGTNPLDETPTYNYNKKIRRRFYEDYKQQEQEVHTNQYIKVDCKPFSGDSLAPMPSAVPCTGKQNMFPQDMYYQKEQGNNPMNYASASVIATPSTTETQDQRKYLAKRLEDVYYTKSEPLEAMFGLIDDEAPTTAKDMDERIKAGKFIIRGLDKPERWFESYNAIQWRDPAKKADMDGFDAARKALKAEKQKALDSIKIDEPKAGLEAVKALEAWEPTGAAS